MAPPRKLLYERRLSDISSILDQSAASSNHTGVGKPPHCRDARNVVIFGEAGAGKSSLVNLIAGTNVAVTSPDASGCTTGINMHEIVIHNETLKVKLFDTPGLDEGPQSVVPDRVARRILKNRVEQGDIHLIMYCVRGERVIQTLNRNYKFIQSIVKMKVPIVLVVTCLESYQPEMEEWWRVNERAISNVGMTFAGHACVTTATTGPKVKERRDQSHIDVCKLIIAASGTRQKIIVVIGETGVGKSSLINLMADKYVAGTSASAAPCTMRWQEHPIEMDGESYRVFDTVGLKKRHLGIPQYLDAVENAYKLIQELERQGGIDLLLLCMRPSESPTTLQSNYRLFHEFLCDKKVPIVVVITHLENQRGRMDDWWKRNEEVFLGWKVHVAGHACITAIRGNFSGRYQESRIAVRELAREFAADGQKQTWIGKNSPSVSFMAKMPGWLFMGCRKLLVREYMVLCLFWRCNVPRAVAKALAHRIEKD